MLYCTHQVVEVESVWLWRVDKCSCVATPDLSPSNTFPEFLRLIWLSSNFRFFFFLPKINTKFNFLNSISFSYTSLQTCQNRSSLIGRVRIGKNQKDSFENLQNSLCNNGAKWVSIPLPRIGRAFALGGIRTSSTMCDLMRIQQGVGWI